MRFTHGFIPGGSFLPGSGLLTAGLDRLFGPLLSLDQRPEEQREIEIFLSNMRAPHSVRSLDIQVTTRHHLHSGHTDPGSGDGSPT